MFFAVRCYSSVPHFSRRGLVNARDGHGPLLLFELFLLKKLNIPFATIMESTQLSDKAKYDRQALFNLQVQ